MFYNSSDLFFKQRTTPWGVHRLCFIFVCYGFKFLPESLLYWPAFFVISLIPHKWIRERSSYHFSTQNFQHSAQFLGAFRKTAKSVYWLRQVCPHGTI